MAEPDRDVARVLVVEDDRGVRESLAMVLGHEGHDVVEADHGEACMAAIDSHAPDLVILDINLPGIDGIEICRRLRSQHFDEPILMLTARHDLHDRVRGLDAGADDYLPKPFALQELLARVRALLRRNDHKPGRTTYRIADLEVDPSSRTAARDGRYIELTKIEYDLLELLVSNAEVVLTRDLIGERVWGHQDDLGSNSLEVFVSNLRRKTEQNGEVRLIHTVRGVGYVARAPR